MSFILIAFALILLATALFLYRYRRGRGVVSNDILLARTFGKILGGERDAVVDEMRRLYRQTDQDVGIGLALGVLLRHAGKNQVAIRTHRSLITRLDLADDLKAMIYTELCADYLESGLLERARAALDQARTLRECDEQMVRLGERVLTRLGDWDAAFKLVQAYGKKSGTDVAERLGLLRFEQGEQLRKENKEEEAYAAFKKAISAHDKCVPAYLACSRHLRHHQKAGKASSYLKKRMDFFNGHEWLAMKEFMKIAMAGGQHNIFLEEVEKRLETEPEDWRSRSVLGRFYMETGSYKQAAEELLNCLMISPQTLVLHQRLWTLMLRDDEPWEMFRAYQGQIRENLVFSDPYVCRACFFHAPKLLWFCPSCHRTYSFTETKV